LETLLESQRPDSELCKLLFVESEELSTGDVVLHERGYELFEV